MPGRLLALPHFSHAESSSTRLSVCLCVLQQLSGWFRLFLWPSPEPAGSCGANALSPRATGEAGTRMRCVIRHVNEPLSHPQAGGASPADVGQLLSDIKITTYTWSQQRGRSTQAFRSTAAGSRERKRTQNDIYLPLAGLSFQIGQDARVFIHFLVLGLHPPAGSEVFFQSLCGFVWP